MAPPLTLSPSFPPLSRFLTQSLPSLYPISTLSPPYLEVAIEAWDPDALVLLGPGAALGGAIGQVLVRGSSPNP